MKKKMPTGLKATGRALWTTVVEDVPEGMTLDAVEYASLELAARMIDKADEHDRRVARDGELTEGSGGQPVAHPLIREARIKRATAAGILRRVNLTPPAQRTGHMSKRQRDQLTDARRERWPVADA